MLFLYAGFNEVINIGQRIYCVLSFIKSGIGYPILERRS